MAPLASQMSSPVATTRIDTTTISSNPTTTPPNDHPARTPSRSFRLTSLSSSEERDVPSPRLPADLPSPTRPSPLLQVDADTHPRQLSSGPSTGPSSALSSTFTINVPPPPVSVPRLLLHSIEVPSVNVDQNEEFLINPAEFRVKSVSRITAPAGRVLYDVIFQDGHSAEIPVADIYTYVSEDEIERLENQYFKDDKNPETFYDFDPQYPGGEPSGGTYASLRGYLSGYRRRKVSRQRLVPTEKTERVKAKMAGAPTARRGRPGRPRGSSSRGGRRLMQQISSRKGFLAVPLADSEGEDESPSGVEDDPLEVAVNEQLAPEVQTNSTLLDETSESEDDASISTNKRSPRTDEDMTESDDLSHLKARPQASLLINSLKRKTPPSPDGLFPPLKSSNQFPESQSSTGLNSQIVVVPPQPPPNNAKPNMQRFLNAALAHSRATANSTATSVLAASASPPNSPAPPKASKASTFLESAMANKSQSLLSSIVMAKKTVIPTHIKRPTSRGSGTNAPGASNGRGADTPSSAAKSSQSINLAKRVKSAPFGRDVTPSLLDMDSTPQKPTTRVAGFTPINIFYHAKSHPPDKTPEPGIKSPKSFLGFKDPDAAYSPSAAPKAKKITSTSSSQVPKLKNIRTAPTKQASTKPKSIRTPPVPKSPKSGIKIIRTKPTPVKSSAKPKSIRTKPASVTSSSSTASSKSKRKKTPVENADEVMHDANFEQGGAGVGEEEGGGREENNETPRRIIELSIMDDESNYLLDEEYMVEKILTYKREGGQKLYLVKWEGYDESQATWEPLENLEQSIDLVNEFERTRLRGG